jgi:hypothetical protein
MENLEHYKNLHVRMSRAVRQMRENPSNFGDVSEWDLPFRPEVDDAAIYAIACYTALLTKGLESQLVMCYTERGEKHVICKAGDHAFDVRSNGTPTMKDLEEFGYSFRYISGFRPDAPWQELPDELLTFA